MNKLNFGALVKCAVMAVLTACLLVAITLPAQAGPEFVFKPLAGATNLYSATNATITSTASTPILLPPRPVSLVILPTYSALAGNNSNNTWGFNLTPQGGSSPTKFSTTTPISVTSTNNGTNVVRPWLVISSTNLVGAAAVRWDLFGTTQTNKVTITSVDYGFIDPN